MHLSGMRSWYRLPIGSVNREQRWTTNALAYEPENEYVAAPVANAPDRFLSRSWSSVNPPRDYAFDEIRACAKDQRISVMKLHFTNSDVDLKNPDHVNRLIDVFRLLDSRGLSVLVHMRTRSDDYGAGEAGIFIRSVLAETPGLHVQIAHVTGWGGYDDATDSALGAFASAFAESTIEKKTPVWTWRPWCSILTSPVKTWPSRTRSGQQTRSWANAFGRSRLIDSFSLRTGRPGRLQQTRG